jgi:uncharacterized membrane protein (DUF485 family)
MRTSTILTLLAGFLSLLAIAAIIVIVLRAPTTTDQLTLIGAIIAFLTPLITSVIALIRSEQANGTATKANASIDTHLQDINATKSPSSPLP